MTAPSIEMIAASLKSCSLGRGRPGGQASPPSPATPSLYHRHPYLTEASDESSGVTVELNSETALPYHWQQCLDMRTGEIYYINRQTGSRTTVDPRTSSAKITASATTTYKSSYCYSGDEDDSDTSDDDSCSAVGGCDDCDDTADSSSITTLSSPSPSDASSTLQGGVHVLVAAGCKSCFMYFMVPKRVDACPKCGSGGLLHLGRSSGCV